MDVSRWLQSWYSAQCDGDWEHQHGVKIGTLDNPGWSLDVDLVGTALEGRAFSEVKQDRSEQDWIYCALREGRFYGRGGALNLTELIEVFRAWAEADSALDSK